jgi:hypothetical protein
VTSEPAALAVVLESPVQRIEAVIDAVRSQTAGVTGVLAVCGDGASGHRAGAEAVSVPAGSRSAVGFHAGLKAALGGDQRWLWLLDGTAVPRPDALEHLLGAADPGEGLPAPALVASLVVLANGGLDPSAAPWPRIEPAELVIDAYSRGVVAIRTARHGSMLVAREAVLDRGLPRCGYVADGDDLEWTGRLLRDSLGLFAPASVAVRESEPSRDQTRELKNRTSMLLGAAFDGAEKRWLALELAEQAVAVARRGRPLGALAALAQGMAVGLRQPAQAVAQSSQD